MFNKILFPIDASENSKRATTYVIDLARKFGASVTILHAYELPGEISVIGGRYGTSTYSFVEHIEKDLFEHGQLIVKNVKTEIEEQGIATETILVKGSPEQAIIDTIHKNDISLVVMCSRGMGAVERFLLGSVSDYVIHHTKCPVFLVH